MKVKDEYELNGLIERIKEFPVVLAIILFGSYAKETAKEISDIDIAVVVRNPDKHIEGEIGTCARKSLMLCFSIASLYTSSLRF